MTRAIADVGGGVVKAEVEIEAPPDPPRRLVFTWRPSWDDYVVTTVRYDLTPTAAGTRLTVTHTGFGDGTDAATGTGDGWMRVLEWLAEYAGHQREASAS